MLGGQDEPVNQVVHVGVVQLGVLAADEHLDVPGQDALEELAEHGLVAATPDAAGPDRAGLHAANTVLRQHESLRDDLCFGVQVVESLGVGQGFVTAGDALAAHHHAVGRRVDEPLDPRVLGGFHQVLGAADVDGEAAPAVLVGDRRATHQVDDRCGVEDGVDALDGGRDGVLVADVALDDLQPRMRGERGRRAVERAHLVASLEQLGHQVRPDEAGAAGDQHTAELGAHVRSRTIGSQRCITHAGEHK